MRILQNEDYSFIYICTLNKLMMPLFDEIEIEDMEYNSEKELYSYPCPCGSAFYISLYGLIDGETIAYCPDCTLFIKVIYDIEDFKCALCSE